MLSFANSLKIDKNSLQNFSIDRKRINLREFKQKKNGFQVCWRHHCLWIWFLMRCKIHIFHCKIFHMKSLKHVLVKMDFFFSKMYSIYQYFMMSNNISTRKFIQDIKKKEKKKETKMSVVYAVRSVFLPCKMWTCKTRIGILFFWFFKI